MMLEDLTKANLAENLHTLFQLHVEPDRTSELELVELTDGRASPEYEAFALLFRGPAGERLAQGLYRLEHAHLGAFDLFIVPVGQDQVGTYYEAVFNRLVAQGG